jgi:phosphatidylserine/phosphatidylglycerophosphate/cardiolipin synthase-like enzyme
MNKQKLRFMQILPELVLFIFLLTSACQTKTPIYLDPVQTPDRSQDAEHGSLMNVYFTDPQLDGYRGGPDSYLAAALDEARYEIDGAVYDFNLWSIRDALIRAHRRGVRVRLVAEKDFLDREEIQELISAGIKIVPDQNEALMHNKFFVIDGSEVWTGSMNFTVNGAYRHLNNLVRIRSSLLAENYQAEFEEMYTERLFGEDVLFNTPHPTLTLDGIRVETYFSPDDDALDRVEDLIRSANQSIDFLYYSFTDDDSADAIISRAADGVAVRGVLDAYQNEAGLGSEYEKFREGNFEVYLDRYPEKLHHKVIILDGEILVTGSANLTYSADVRNDENILIIHSPDLAALFVEEFNWIFQQAAE